MGLLEQILGAAVRRRGGTPDLGDLLGGRTGRAASGGRGALLLKLLPLVVMLLRNRAGRSVGGRGGLGGLAGLAGLGGLGGLLAHFNNAGLSRQADSWVQVGDNMPISPDEVERALGPDTISQVAAQAGVSESEAADGVAQLLPELVDQLTPEGSLPAETQVDTALDDLTRSLGA